MSLLYIIISEIRATRVSCNGIAYKYDYKIFVRINQQVKLFISTRI